MKTEINFDALFKLGFSLDEDAGRMSYHIGNNVELVFNTDDEWSIRPQWGSTDGYYVWGKPKTIKEVKTLIKLLANEEL